MLKFGGSSVGTAKAMRLAAEKIRKCTGKRLVVLSACAGITNHLHTITASLSRAEELMELDIKSAKSSFLKAVNTLREIDLLHSKIISELLANGLLPEYSNKYYQKRKELRKRILGALLLRKITPNNAVSIVSMGEYFSTLIFVSYLKEQGLPASWADSFEYLWEKDRPTLVNNEQAQKLTDNFDECDILVIQGYIRRDVTGKLSNFGRGGSDYTAALLGEILNAQQVQIYTDVDGVYSSDPRKVVNAKILKKISPHAMGMMALFGAKVMHPDSLKPAISSAVPVSIKNTFSESKGTEISYPSGSTPVSDIPTLTLGRDITKVQIDLIGQATEENALANIRENIFSAEPLFYAESGTGISAFIQKKDFNKLSAVLSQSDIAFSSSAYPLLLITSFIENAVFLGRDNAKTVTDDNNLAYSSTLRIFDDNMLIKQYGLGRSSYLLELSQEIDDDMLSGLHDYLLSIKNAR